MALSILVREMRWRVFAITFDNGFISPSARGNIAHMTASLGVEHAFIALPRGDMARIYRASLAVPFGEETTKYSTSACGACISVILTVGTIQARAKHVGLLCGGWTPGQLTPEAIVPGSLVSAIADRHLSALKGVDGVAALSAEANEPSPPLFNPLYTRDYNEDEVLAHLRSVGWSAPKDTDSCSTNCQLNGFLVVDHIRRYGYHPYEFELAHHVRIGAMPRHDAIHKIEHLRVSRRQIASIERRLLARSELIRLPQANS